MSDGTPSIAFDPGAPDPSRAGQAVPTGAVQPPKPKALEKADKAAMGDTLTLSPEAKAEVAKLQARDADVRAHENAHLAAGGGIVTGGANYTYQEGPDGRNYAVGGEVGVDTSPVRGNPQATIAKAMHIMAAALAPADPSGQDRSVAAQAASMAAQAAGEVAKQAVVKAPPPAKGEGSGQEQAGARANPYRLKAGTPEGSLIDALG
jgi:hypothetical protein